MIYIQSFFIWLYTKSPLICYNRNRANGLEPCESSILYREGFILCCPSKKKRQFSFGRLSFLFVLFTFIFSLFSLLLNCRFQRKDKSEKRREKVALLRKALNYIIICGIIQSEVMTNEQSFAR